MSEFIRYLNDADHDLMWISIAINQLEFYSRIVAIDIAFDVDNLISLHMLFYFLLKDNERISKVNFERTGVIRNCFHYSMDVRLLTT